MVNKQPSGIKPGIYFNLSNEDYHSDSAIGCSNIKDLLESPLQYWWKSIFNPKREREESKALMIGSALHCYLMERKKFNKQYIVLPSLEIDSDFYRRERNRPDFFSDFQLRKTKDAKTFEYIGDRMPLKEDEFDKIKQAVERLESLPSALNLIKNGAPEVSIFWKDEETGLMCKCRHDYLTINASLDYKSIAESISKSKIKKSIAEYQYPLQATWYLEGLNRIKDYLIKNKVPAPRGINAEWWKLFTETKHNSFVFLFQTKKAPYLTRLKTFNEEVLDFFLEKAKYGLKIYKDNIEKYGENIWQDENENYIEMLGFEDLPSYIQYM